MVLGHSHCGSISREKVLTHLRPLSCSSMTDLRFQVPVACFAWLIAVVFDALWAIVSFHLHPRLKNWQLEESSLKYRCVPLFLVIDQVDVLSSGFFVSYKMIFRTVLSGVRLKTWPSIPWRSSLTKQARDRTNRIEKASACHPGKKGTRSNCKSVPALRHRILPKESEMPTDRTELGSACPFDKLLVMSLPLQNT